MLGIRPEDFHLEELYKSKNGKNTIKLISENCEMTGSEINIYSRIGENRSIARVAADSKAADGEAVTLFADTEKIHIFDRDSGELICD